MKFLEVTGKTINEALNSALTEWNVTKDDIEFEVFEEPSKGFFGFGAKPGKWKVTLKDKSESSARMFINDILQSMNIKGEIHINKDGEDLKINIIGSEAGALIGRRGDTLDSLQLLVGLVVNKNCKTHKRVLLDIENYREKRTQSLIRYANKLAKDVVKFRKVIKLEPMNPYERRIIHSALQNDAYVNTYSEGTEPNRKVVIALKKISKTS